MGGHGPVVAERLDDVGSVTTVPGGSSFMSALMACSVIVDLR